MRRDSRPRIRSRLLAAALGLAVAPALPAGGADTAPPRGDPAARLPESEESAEAWDLVAGFDSGHWVYAQALITNLGPGDHDAAVFGVVVGPDGRALPFRRSEEREGWRLLAGGRGLDLRSIVLDLGTPGRRLEVDKNELGVRVDVEAAGAPAWPEAGPSDCPLDVLDVASRAGGRIRVEGAGPVALRGRAALTHRWTHGLEADCVVRRVEFFSLGDPGLYWSEELAADGRVRRFAAVERDGRIETGAPEHAAVRWGGGATGFPAARALRVDLASLSWRAEIGEPVLELAALDLAPAVLRPILARRTQPRLLVSPAPFEVRTRGAPAAARAGLGVVKVSYLNPVPAGALGVEPASAAE